MATLRQCGFCVGGGGTGGAVGSGGGGGRGLGPLNDNRKLGKTRPTGLLTIGGPGFRGGVLVVVGWFGGVGFSGGSATAAGGRKLR